MLPLLKKSVRRCCRLNSTVRGPQGALLPPFRWDFLNPGDGEKQEKAWLTARRGVLPTRGQIGVFSSRTAVPERTRRNTVASPRTRPITLTGLAAQGASPLLAGVGPKKMQKAW